MGHLLMGTATTGGVVFIWLLIILLFLLSFIGVLVPVVPSVLLLWLGFISFHFFIDSSELTVYFWLSMALFTLILLGADFYINMFFVDQFGGSKWSKWGAFFGIFIGMFVYPPLGIMIVPLLIVFFIELTIHGEFKRSFFTALGTLAAFLSSAVAKVFLQLLMIFIFFLFIII